MEAIVGRFSLFYFSYFPYSLFLGIINRNIEFRSDVFTGIQSITWCFDVYFLFRAIISISTNAPKGNSLTLIVVRAGYGVQNCSAYTSFISLKLFISVR